MKTAQIDLTRLSQQQAAALLGQRSSWIRDRADMPRNADGSYDGSAVVAWHLSHQPDAEVTEADIERALIVFDRLLGGLDIGIKGFVAWMEELEQQHGNSGLEWFVRFTVAAMKAHMAKYPGDYKRPADETLFCQHTVCEQCRRVRHANSWKKSECNPGWHVIREFCPSCTRKFA